jgi:ubiquinone/menaquinone biosynthesis C-methylase UbiE
MKKDLKNTLWKKESYYKEARIGSLDKRHPGMLLLKKLSKDSDSVLDLGCGEGTRLNYLCGKGKKCLGVDISKTAIRMAKKNYPSISFKIADLEKLPMKSETFELCYLACVLEHLDKPEKVINEAVRITDKKGKIVFIAPNFGAPNRASPPFKGSRLLKFVKGLLIDLRTLFFQVKKLNWHRVIPFTDPVVYESDWDTTIEPYLYTLIKYLEYSNLKVTEWMSCWSEELPNARFLQILIRLFGERRIYPFKYWGPHFVVVAQK